MRIRRLTLSGLVPLMLAVTSCGGGGGSPGLSTGTGGQTIAPPGPNVATITVDAGPSPNGQSVNSVDIPYTTVTICSPGSTAQCQTFDHIEVDSGSYGFRILADATDTSGNPFSLNLPAETSGGSPIAECAQFVDGYSWGPITTADIQIAGESAASVPVQVIGDPTVSGDTGFPSVPSSCASIGTAEDTVSAFGANGIIGVGPFTHDCGSGCATNTANGFYYNCPSSGGCLEISLGKPEQVTNPVADFQTDNNGVIIELPSIPSTGAATASGSLVFGIGTESNNSLSGKTVLTANLYGDVTTQFNGQSLPYSLFDTGSNGYYFNDSSISTCTSTSLSGWFCPNSTVTLNATNYAVSSGGTQTGTMSSVTIKIGNAGTLFANNDTAYNDIGGSSGDQSAYCPNSAPNCSFDFGLPFFFGRNVYVAISGANVSGGGLGPFFAY